jgi:hypothetical protein
MAFNFSVRVPARASTRSPGTVGPQVDVPCPAAVDRRRPASASAQARQRSERPPPLPLAPRPRLSAPPGPGCPRPRRRPPLERCPRPAQVRGSGAQPGGRRPQGAPRILAPAPSPEPPLCNTKRAGLFGASSTPSFAFSFSQAPASQPPASQSLFGAAAPAATPGVLGATPGLFGAAAAQPQMSPLGLGPGATQGPDLSAVRELESIKDAFVPGGAPGGVANPRYRFQYLLLNVVENPAARVKPPGVDELQWREALQRAGGPDNPDHLWPVPATGFRDLLSRWEQGLRVGAVARAWEQGGVLRPPRAGRRACRATAAHAPSFLDRKRAPRCRRRRRPTCLLPD